MTAFTSSRRRRRNNKGESLVQRQSSRVALFVLLSAGVFVAAGLSRDGTTGGVVEGSGRELYMTPATNETLMCGDRLGDNGTVITSDLYPRDIFTREQCLQGALVLHWFGMLYMFLGLSIVCDEFFVPALEEMYQNRFHVEDDVAGATFMAAGGSAPELATSLIGTFAGSSVGFGTIVGSAVFNVLFVIGACALASKDKLQLTAFPLARDCVWYVVSLALLAVWFSGNTPGKIDLWEALVQFGLYGGYVIIMIYNKQLRTIFHDVFKIKPAQVEIEMNETDPADAISSHGVPGASFHNKLARLITQQMTTQDLVAFHAVNCIPGDVRDTFDRLDEEKNGRIETQNLRKLLETLGAKDISDKHVNEAMSEVDNDGSGDIDFDEFELWYKASETRFVVEMDREFSRIDVDESGDICMAELKTLLISLGDDDATDEECQAIINAVDENGDGRIDREEFKAWYLSGELFQMKRQEAQKALEIEEEGLLAWPDTALGKLMFIITLPLVLFLVFTIPDVRKSTKLLCCKHSDYYPFSFVSSVIAIGGFSFVMVWFATTIGIALNIPDEIMGLTFLAAGTSVPDLLTSVAVSRQGHGDMAISSSIGSNIFDVTVGLPLPWLLFCLFNLVDSVDIGNSKVGTSIVLLVLMLILVVGAISVFGWKLSKKLGAVMFLLYGIFLTVEILRNEAFNALPDFQVINF